MDKGRIPRDLFEILQNLNNPRTGAVLCAVYKTRWEKKIKCSASLTFYLFSPTRLIYSIKHEHSPTSGLSILLHDVISFPDAMSYDKLD